ncbi:NAD(P)-dependent alcohol dehydrogenase [Nocardioides sp.]|uniref:NAD(P)-dependent alcohol dehydrogenase n=1 Tax=Nocardioides sp. TaxID=35761 RepID=UPI002BC8729E|nr:NAD(P)-dependent alcohol dehydrogenase [Nocardioides sp.]HXH80734.1 NAD(P)-dependent alcohol dehydrogenase [Nocardioides sp.]
MKAAVHREYGAPQVVHIEERPDPVPSAKQVLIRVHASAVTAADSRIRGARFPRGYGVLARMIFGLRRPRSQVRGVVVSGVVEAVGAQVKGFAVGDEVCGSTGMGGAHAELATASTKRLVHKPAAVSHEQAAGMLFGGSTALHFVRDVGHVSAGQTVLVNGASGAVGTNAVQLAKHFGAEVTAVTSAANAALLKELGADHVVDYAITPVAGLTERFDVVMDTVGNIGIEAGRRLLTDDGVMLLVAGTLGEALRARGNVKGGTTAERAENYATLLDLVADGTLTVVNQHVLELEDIVRAYEIADSGRKVGNVVVRP